MSEKKLFDEAAKAMKEKLGSIFSKDDPDEASPEDRTKRPQIIGDIAYELAFGGEEAMREPKGTFDDAIYILRLEEQEDAARVLEVVGKVDKTRCKEWLSFRSYYLNPTPRDQATKNQINALLDSLPDDWKTIKTEEQV
jgi:hypothetical protein